ncbi:ABC transporter C family member 8, partial [Colletotrichum tanaceti]
PWLPSDAPPTADDAFGPIVQNCRQGFDSTLTFGQCLFTILPVLLLLLAAPLRLHHLAKRPLAVTGTAFRLAKQAAIAVLAVLQLAFVALWPTRREASRLRTVSIVASCVSLAAAVMFGVLSYKEHAKSLKPSSILNTYMLVSLVLDGANSPHRMDVALKRRHQRRLLRVFRIEGGHRDPRGLRKDDVPRWRAPEETSGIYSRGLFWWLTPLLLTGFRRLLKPLDLFVLHGSMTTAVLDEKFWRKCNNASSFSAAVQSDASPRPKRYRLIRTCVSTLKWQLLAVILPRIFLLGFTICRPLVLNRFLDFLQNTPEDVSYGYGLIGAYGFVYLGISISSSFYWHKAFRSLAMLRGILVTAVYSKTTELRVAPGDNSAAVTLMSTDIDAIIRAWREVHEFWANTIQIALATWLLSTPSGPIVVSVVAMTATVFFAPAAQKYQVIWVEKVQRRIGVHFPPTVSDAVLIRDKGITSAMIGHIKSIKMSGLTQKLLKTLADLRVDEMKAAIPFRVIGAITSAVAQVPLMLAPVVAFAMYTTIVGKTGQTLDATKLEPPLLDVRGCLRHERCLCIETYLTEPPRVDYRSFPCDLQPGTQSTGSGWSSQDIQLRSLENREDYVLEGNPRNRPAISKDEAESILNGLNFDILKGQLVMLVGPVASGKSTLLKGLLGELRHVTGTLALFSTRVSWCERSSWLINETVRKNTICFSEFDLHLYRQVLKACDLEKDLAQFPGGGLDKYLQQGHRLEWRSNAACQIALFDDIFSGLDDHTARVVFQRVFSADEGMLRAWGTSIVLATESGIQFPFNHQAQSKPMTNKKLPSVSFLSRADMIVTLKDGKFAEMGSFENCRNADGYDSNLVASGPLSRVEDEARQEKTANDTTSQVMQKKEAKAIEELEDKRRQLGDWSVYGYYFGSVGIVLVAIMLFLQVTWAFFSTFLTIWLKFWTDANVEAPERLDAYYLGVYAALQVGGRLLNTYAARARSHALIDRSQRLFHILLLTQQWLTLVLDLATAALAVRLRATASIGPTGVSLVQLISFTETLRMLIQLWTSLETSIGAVARIKNFSEETADEVEDDRLTRHDRAPETDLKGGWPERGAIEICDVPASYDATGSGKDGRTAATRALGGISISIRPGEKIGVVGRTGSGKPSLLLALLRLLPLFSGTISIDGRPIDSLPLLPLRSGLIAITQDQYLDPLGTASTARDAAAESALARLGLWDTIRDNGGLDAEFAEEALNHGQRQLFFLARAILRRHVGRVVLLDEATS